MADPAPGSAGYRRYLDAAAGAPLRPVAREAWLAAVEDGWADPAKLYSAGRRARVLLDAARASVAADLGARPDEISFAANAAQAMHSAVLGVAAGNRRAPTLVYSAVEHSAILHAVEEHERAGGRSAAVGVDELGRVDRDAFVAEAGRPGICAAVLQAANHEVGTRQPVSDIAAAVPKVPLVVDASQALGHVPVPDGWSVLAADARTWGGPTLGLLAVRAGTRWRCPLPADEREAGRVPGVPNVPDIVAAAAALHAATTARDTEAARLSVFVDRIRATVVRTVPDCVVLGDPDDRLPHLVTFSCLYADGEALLSALDRRGYAVSSGSSCTSSTLEPSHVLVAMGALTSGNIRVSLHHETTAAEIDEFLAVLPGVVADVRAELGAAGL